MNISYDLNQSNLQKNKIVINIDTHKRDTILHHNHMYTELTVVLGGSAIHEVEGYPFAIKQGDVYVVPPEMNHRYLEVQELYLCDILISIPTFLQYNSTFDLLPSFHELFLHSGSNPKLHHFNQFHIESEEDFNFINELCHRTLKEYDSKPMGYEIIFSNYFTALLSCLLRTFPVSSKMSNFRLHNAIEYIHAHYTEKISVKILSEQCSLSERQFYRLFKTIYGLPPTQYIIQMRIAHASHLLTTTQLPLSTIAIQSGFPDQSLFSKQFSEYYHITPRKFRQKSYKNN